MDLWDGMRVAIGAMTLAMAVSVIVVGLRHPPSRRYGSMTTGPYRGMRPWLHGPSWMLLAVFHL